MIETSIAFLQPVRPREEGGKRRIALAKFEGDTVSFENGRSQHRFPPMTLSARHGWQRPQM